jgi:uncharacterized phage protein (TIGR01671 family)
MSRLIMFRRWDTEEKKWLLGYEYPNLGGFSMFGEVMMMGEYAKLLSHYFPDRLEDIDVMQFTGVKDKNGKEIYEGDIVSGHNGDGTPNVWPVEYACENSEWTGFNVGADDEGDCEVIGNIYENPELLN